MRLLTADWIHHRGALRREHALLLAEGRVLAAGPLAAVEAAAVEAAAAEAGSAPGPQGLQRVHLAGKALVPGTVSAHSHAFQILLRGKGDHPRSFSDWVTTRLYPLIASLDDDSLRAASELCFAQMARAGITSVGEFHYVHNATDGRGRAFEQAQIVVDAARRVGLRITLLYTLYDVRARPGQARMAHSAELGAQVARDLAARYRDDPAVLVAPAPHSLHGASRGAIEVGAALADELDMPWHIHLAEQQADVPSAEERYGVRPLEALETWGVLTERTVLVHGIWLSPEERALLAARGGSLVTNPTTNMALGDGIAALSELVAAGVCVALGTDMNAAPNVFSELRTAEYLQRVAALRMGCIPRAGSETPEPARLFELATRNGARVLGQDAGELAPGQWADLLVVDLGAPSLLPASALSPEDPEAGAALLNLLASAMVPEEALSEVWVAGEAIVRSGEVSGLSLRELGARLRGCAALRPA